MTATSVAPVLDTVEKVQAEVDRIDQAMQFGPIFFSSGLLTMEFEVAAMGAIRDAMVNLRDQATEHGISLTDLGVELGEHIPTDDELREDLLANPDPRWDGVVNV